MTSRFLACALSAAVLAITPSAQADTLKKPALDRLAVQPGLRTSGLDFRRFAAIAAQQEPALRGAVDAYAAGRPLAGDDLVNVARLLGLYSRLQHQGAVIDSIGKMVALPTVRNPRVPPHESPAIVQTGTLIESMAREFGLAFRNVDNRIFEVKLPGSGAEEFGILTHADVVPANIDEWVLDDGTRLDPFQLTRVGDLMYGRGTIDDKGSIAAVLHAMKAVKQSGLPIARTIRLMVETTEETGGDAMKYYRETNPLPAYNIVLDSKYPAVVAEKGSGALKVSFPVVNAPDAVDPRIVEMNGSASVNAIPQTATARLVAGDVPALVQRLEAARAGFIQRLEPQGGRFTIDIARREVQGVDGVDVRVTGVSAHGSRPEEGVNPVPRLAMFLHEAPGPLVRNHHALAVKYIAELYGTDYLGRTLGVAYADGFMGPLTISPTFVRLNGNQLDVTANVRMPRGRSPEELKSALASRIAAWASANKVEYALAHDQGDWMARDPQGAWLSTLLNIFGDTTGLEAKPVPTAGSTTAKLMPNAINFGPAMPGKKYTAHNAKEYKEVADLDADLQMFTEMLVRIGNLPQMQ
ncbi:MAG: dipeptidase [Bordetella sp.]|nr:dipeptidase [Pseudomonadota bacterium]